MRRWWRPDVYAVSTAAVLVVALGLRVYPLHVAYIHPDQDYVPTLALHGLVHGTWRPAMLRYPSGFLYALQATYGLGYGIGRLAGELSDRVDLAVAFVLAPFPFLLAARLIACVFGVLTVVLAMRLGRLLFGRPAGLLAGLAMATNVLAVRESHHGTGDIVATALATAGLVATVGYLRRGRPRDLLVASALTGLATGVRYQLACVGLALAAAISVERRLQAWTRAYHLLLAVLCAGAFFVLLVPYSVLEPARAWHDMGLQWQETFRTAWPGAMGLGTVLPLVLGWPMCVLVAVGLVELLRRTPVDAVVLAACLVPYAVVVAVAGRPFVRYALPLIPPLLALAAGGVVALGHTAPARWRPAVTLAVLLASTGGTTCEVVAYDRLLAREDTRLTARRWLLAHAGPDTRVFIATGLYAAPALPWWFGIDVLLGRDVARAAARRWVGRLPPVEWVLDDAAIAKAKIGRAGGYVVTAEHPVLDRWVGAPPAVTALVASRGVLVASFDGVEEASGHRATFEESDANFVPLRGASLVGSPGPNLRVWRIDPE